MPAAGSRKWGSRSPARARCRCAPGQRKSTWRESGPTRPASRRRRGAPPRPPRPAPTAAAPSTTSGRWRGCWPGARCGWPSSAREGSSHEARHQGHRERRAARGAGRLAPPARPPLAREPAPDRHAHRLRHHPLRRLHRPARRRAGEVVHHPRRPGRRRPGRHRGRAGAERQGPSHPGGLLGEARAAMRLLHAGNDDDRLRAARPQQESHRGRDPRGHQRQPVPLHRLREHRQGHRIRSRQAAAAVGGSMTEPKTSATVCGMGHSMKRKEDPRFIRGRGNYVDDIQLPGMLHMDIVRSPYAYAKIKSIDSEKALKIPGVLAVITGETLKKYNLHWMPTLMSDTQMVLPTDTVMYQAQEVAAVIATDRYAAADGVEAVEVEYEPMTPVIDAWKALDPSAPVLRTDKKDKK